MAVNVEKYAKMLKGLTPRGEAWNTRSGTNFSSLLFAMADEMLRIHSRSSTTLLNELIPSTSLEMLDDWERILSLPDECTGVLGSLAQRRNQIIYKLSTLGGQSRQFFIDLAANLGFEITITEFRPFRVGRSETGDELTNGAWVHAWQVNAAENTVSYFRTGRSVAGDRLAAFGNDILECVITKGAPAHTIVLFAYE